MPELIHNENAMSHEKLEFLTTILQDFNMSWNSALQLGVNNKRNLAMAAFMWEPLEAVQSEQRLQIIQDAMRSVESVTNMLVKITQKLGYIYLQKSVHRIDLLQQVHPIASILSLALNHAPNSS